MAISDKLNYLIETKQLFKDRLNSLGAEITSSTTFRNYLTWLDTFYGEVSDKTDLSVNGVVGRTSQNTATGKNLFDKNNANIINGYFAPSVDNVITLNNSHRILYISCQSNTTYTVQKSTEGGSLRFSIGTTNEIPTANITVNQTILDNNASSLTITTNATAKYLLAYFYNTNSTITLEEMLSSIQIEEGSTATSYEEYTGNQPSPNPDYPQPINNLSGDVAYKVSGKNLFDLKQRPSASNGLTSTINSNGTIHVSGTATTTWADITAQVPVFIENNTQVTFSIEESLPVKVVCNLLSNQGAGQGVVIENDYTSTTITTNNEKNTAYIYISGLTANTQYDFIIKKPMLEKGSTATSYEPYISQTFNIPLKSKNLANLSIINKVPSIYNGNLVEFIDGGSTDYIEIDNTKELTLSYKLITNAHKYVFFYDANKEYLGYDDDYGNVSNPYTISNNRYYSNTKYIKIRTDLISGIEWVQVEYGPNTSYEPYYDIELCKANTYEDKIYSSNCRFYLRKENGKVTLNGSESGWENTYGTNLFDINKFLNSKPFIVGYGLCNYCRYNSVQSGINNALSNGEFALQKYTGNVDAEYSIFIKNTSFNNVNDFKTWLSTHNTIVYYPLATPTTTEITQENYPSLYNALKQIQDYLTAYKINKEFILGYSSPEIEY